MNKINYCRIGSAWTRHIVRIETGRTYCGKNVEFLTDQHGAPVCRRCSAGYQSVIDAAHVEALEMAAEREAAPTRVEYVVTTYRTRFEGVSGRGGKDVRSNEVSVDIADRTALRRELEANAVPTRMQRDEAGRYEFQGYVTEWVRIDDWCPLPAIAVDGHDGLMNFARRGVAAQAAADAVIAKHTQLTQAKITVKATEVRVGDMVQNGSALVIRVNIRNRVAILCKGYGGPLCYKPTDYVDVVRDVAQDQKCECKPHPLFGHEDKCRYRGLGG